MRWTSTPKETHDVQCNDKPLLCMRMSWARGIQSARHALAEHGWHCQRSIESWAFRLNVTMSVTGILEGMHNCRYASTRSAPSAARGVLNKQPHVLLASVGPGEGGAPAGDSGEREVRGSCVMSGSRASCTSSTSGAGSMGAGEGEGAAAAVPSPAAPTCPSQVGGGDAAIA